MNTGHATAGLRPPGGGLEPACPGPEGSDLVVVLQQDPEDALHALRLHRLAGEVQQELQRVGGVGGFAQVHVKSCRLAGLGQTQLLGRRFFMYNLG